MKIVGIVGGIASGKSEVAAVFGRLGATVIDADRLGHQVLLEPDVRQAALTRWGTAILAPTGELDRARIADRVFANSETSRADREFWDDVTHPRIRERIMAQIDDELRRNPNSIVILEAALLLEAGWNKMCDAIIYVDAPRQVRQQRALGRGWTVRDFERREAAQWNPSEKRKLSNFVIDNTGTRKQIYDQVLDVWRVLSDDVGPCPPMVNPPKGLQ